MIQRPEDKLFAPAHDALDETMRMEKPLSDEVKNNYEVESPVDSADIDSILSSLAEGNNKAAEALFPLVYDQLHHLANSQMRRERQDHTLQPTALIHEAYMRLVQPESSRETGFENIEHFMATAAVVMRRILINHAKSKSALKRGGDHNKIQLEGVLASFESRSIDLIALDESLEELKARDEIQYRVVELRFFGGLSFEQCAKVLEISERQVYYEWAHAKAWLKTKMEAP